MQTHCRQNDSEFQPSLLHYLKYGWFSGGVHREGELTLDVSADLNELGRSKTLVVCSGVKSILDIGRTLEYLVSIFKLLRQSKYLG